MLSRYTVQTIKRVGFTLLSISVSLLALVAILSIIYALVYGSQDGMDHIILGLHKQDVYDFMLKFFWIPLKWFGIGSGVLAAFFAILFIPFIIFRSIYVSGNEHLDRQEKELRR